MCTKVPDAQENYKKVALLISIIEMAWNDLNLFSLNLSCLLYSFKKSLPLETAFESHSRRGHQVHPDESTRDSWTPCPLGRAPVRVSLQRATIGRKSRIYAIRNVCCLCS